MPRPRLAPDQLRPYLVDTPHPRTPQWRELAQNFVPISWSGLFNNDHPVEIEVGFGKGLFLLTQSRAQPDVNFLGIEIERKYVMFAAARLARQDLARQDPARHEPANVRLACTDARWLLQNGVPAGSVAAVHVYFPDPWWKQRHRKRKLVTADFIEQCVRVLTPGGSLHFATDVAEYFEESCALFAAQPQLTPAPEQPMAAEGLTHFERKYRQEGRAIHRACYQRTSHA